MSDAIDRLRTKLGMPEEADELVALGHAKREYYRMVNGKKVLVHPNAANADSVSHSAWKATSKVNVSSAPTADMHHTAAAAHTAAATAQKDANPALAGHHATQAKKHEANYAAHADAASYEAWKATSKVNVSSAPTADMHHTAAVAHEAAAAAQEKHNPTLAGHHKQQAKKHAEKAKKAT